MRKIAAAAMYDFTFFIWWSKLILQKKHQSVGGFRTSLMVELQPTECLFNSVVEVLASRD
jgi:hypothetical protein